MVVIVLMSVAFASFLIKFAIDHDGETLTLGGPTRRRRSRQTTGPALGS